MRLKILLVGFGKLAHGVLENAGERHYFDTLKRTALQNNPSNLNRCFTGDVADARSWSVLPVDYDLVLYCVSPDSRAAESYRQAFLQGINCCIDHFSLNTTTKVLFVSSTSVYAQNDGSWVDEYSPALGSSDASRWLVEAEKALENSHLESTAVRFSGIYGAGRTRLLEYVATGSAALEVEPKFTNRIHERDCVGFLVHLIELIAKGEQLESCYLASDCRPASINDVYDFLAKQLGVELKAAVPNERGLLRRAGSKRCSNQRMRQSGYTLQYPSYVEGYEEIGLDSSSQIREEP